MNTKYTFKSISISEGINEERLKQTLISLSIITDMPIPQRTLEIKNFLKEEKWKDENFQEAIQEKINQIISNPKLKIELKHSTTVKNFPKEQDTQFNIENHTRIFHKFVKIELQIAIAYILKNIDFLYEINQLFADKIEKMQEEFKLSKISKNYGNIPFFENKERINNCLDDNDSLFFPYYFKWQEQWIKFIDSFDELEDYKEQNIIVWKIDFMNSYNNLNPKDFLNRNSMDKVFDKNWIVDLFYIGQLYYCSDCSQNADGENKRGINQKIPYGGIVESHIIANLLILEKMKKIIQTINEVKGYKVIGYTGYADDIAIFIEVSDENENREWSLINDDGLKIKKLKEKLHREFDLFEKLKIHEKKKTKIFYFQKYMDDKKWTSKIFEVKDTYSSISMFKSLVTPNFLSNNLFKIDNYPNNKLDIEESRTYANYKKIEFIEELSRFSFLTKEKIKDIVDKNKHKKDFQFYFMLIYKKLRTNREKELFFESVLNNSHFFANILGADTDLKSVNLKIFNKHWKNNIENILIDLNLFEDKGIYKSVLERNNNYDQEEKSVIDEWQDHSVEKTIYDVIENDFDKNPTQRLLSVIKKVAQLSNSLCSYLKLSNGYIFGENVNSKKFQHNHWISLKVNLFTYFNELFGEKINFLYFRFKLFLSFSENRVQFIKWMKYIANDLDKLADINLKIIYDIDKEYLERIKYTYLSYSKEDTENKITDIDQLYKVRMLSKMLWQNGSFSTHSYTAHNERHGDKLLLRFIELRRSIKEFRWLINKSNVYIFSLIASFYTHDLGMLMNSSDSSRFEGTLKEIHKKHSNYIRSIHGRNSSSIIIEWLGNYLNIKNEDITVMSLAAIAHESGVSSLPPSSKKTIFTSLLLCILDLLDITSERSQLISRKIAGTIASEESKAHWIKHYFTHRITNYKLDNKENKLKIKIEMIDIEKRKKPNQCKKTCAILDSMNIKNADLEKFITKQLNKWLGRKINDLWNLDSDSENKRKDFKIDISIKKVEHIPFHLELDFFRDESNWKKIGKKIGEAIRKIIDSNDD